MKNDYSNLIKKKKVLLWILVLGILIAFFANILIGSSGMDLKTVILTLIGKAPNDISRTIIWNIRLPIGLMAIVVGASLAVGGCEMQTILRNPMASPYTLGISSAASFGAGIGIILGVRFVPAFKNLTIPLNAFIATMGTAGLLYFMSNREDVGRNTIVLFGMALSFMFNALTASLQYLASEQELQGFMFWSFGDLSKTNWNKLAITTIIFIICFTIFLRKSWDLTALSLGDTKAISLGVDVKKLRRQSIVLIALLSATAISFVGTIGFIGLVAPHIARILVGEDQRFLLPISALLGALILSVASIVSKVLIPGVVLPIGIVTSFIGIPFFLALVLKKGEG